MTSPSVITIRPEEGLWEVTDDKQALQDKLNRQLHAAVEARLRDGRPYDVYQFCDWGAPRAVLLLRVPELAEVGELVALNVFAEHLIHGHFATIPVSPRLDVTYPDFLAPVPFAVQVEYRNFRKQVLRSLNRIECWVREV